MTGSAWLEKDEEGGERCARQVRRGRGAAVKGKTSSLRYEGGGGKCLVSAGPTCPSVTIGGRASLASLFTTGGRASRTI